MKRPALAAAIAIASLVLIVLLVPLGAVADAIQSVLVTNWPKVFTVNGTVSVEGPVRTARGLAVREVVVPPINPKDTNRLIQGPMLETEGFAYMVLSLQGQIKGEVYRPGNVGAILLPDDDPIVRAFDEKGIMQFSQEVVAPGVSSASPYFASQQPPAPIGFSRYRTYFYNSSDKTVTVNLFVYLTN